VRFTRYSLDSYLSPTESQLFQRLTTGKAQRKKSPSALVGKVLGLHSLEPEDLACLSACALVTFPSDVWFQIFRGMDLFAFKTHEAIGFVANTPDGRSVTSYSHGAADRRGSDRLIHGQGLCFDFSVNNNVTHQLGLQQLILLLPDTKAPWVAVRHLKFHQALPEAKKLYLYQVGEMVWIPLSAIRYVVNVVPKFSGHYYAYNPWCSLSRMLSPTELVLDTSRQNLLKTTPPPPPLSSLSLTPRLTFVPPPPTTSLLVNQTVSETEETVSRSFASPLSMQGPPRKRSKTSESLWDDNEYTPGASEDSDVEWEACDDELESDSETDQY